MKFLKIFLLSFLLVSCEKKETEKTLIVGTAADNPPYEFIQEGEIVGIDIDIIKAVKYGFCPDDADLDVKQVAISLNSKGGECCISELYRYFQVSGLVKPVTLEEIEAVDRYERF